jgi:protease-4
MAQNRDKIIILIIVGAAFVLFVVLSIIFFFISGPTSPMSFSPIREDKVALVEISGVIEKSDDVVRQIKEYDDDNSVKALVLRVDSPGGGVAASQEIYDQLLKFKDSKRYIVVSMGSVAASGGYYVSCAADTIFADPGTLTGSIGVIFSYPIFKNAMDKLGIQMQVIKSGKLKDVGNFAREANPQDIVMLQSVIDDTYEQFVSVVAKERNLEKEYVKGLADGSVYTGNQARANGLIDKIGTLEDAISKAGEMSNLGDNPRVVKERKLRRNLFQDLLGAFGLDQIKSNIHLWPTLEYRLQF